MRVSSVALLACVLTAACGPPPLRERPAFQGQVRITFAGATVEGRLTWARPGVQGTGTLQFDVVRDGKADNVSLLPPARLVAFRDGVPRTPAADEVRLIAGLAGLLGWPEAVAGIEVAVSAGENRVRYPDDTVLALDVLAEVPARPHGH